MLWQVDHILDTCLSLPEPVLHAPSLNHGPARGSAHRSSERSRSGMPKRCFGRSILSISTHTHNPASQGQQPTQGELIGEGARPVFGQPLRATGPEAAKKCPHSKPHCTGILQISVKSQTMIQTHGKFVGRLTTKKLHFCFRPLPPFSTLMEILERNTMENSGKQNPKTGFKSPPSRGEITVKFFPTFSTIQTRVPAWIFESMTGQPVID
jgi:hypothetical protein